MIVEKLGMLVSLKKFRVKVGRGISRIRQRFSSSNNRFLAYLAILGPGIIAANAGNDASGIATYSTVGAGY
ncbi:MAG: divalent metal cation transporter, partial [Acidobacteriota bacterium]